VLDSLCRNAALVQFGVNKRGIFRTNFCCISPGRKFSILSIFPNAALCRTSSAVLCDLGFFKRGIFRLPRSSFLSLPYRTGEMEARHLAHSPPASLPLRPRAAFWGKLEQKSDKAMSKIWAKYPISSQFLHI